MDELYDKKSLRHKTENNSKQYSEDDRHGIVQAKMQQSLSNCEVSPIELKPKL